MLDNKNKYKTQSKLTSKPPMKLSLSLILIISRLTTLWKDLNIQTLVLTSFAFQLILIVVAPFRKQTSNTIIVVSIWLSYLLADWVAAQAIGLISKALDANCASHTMSSDTTLFTFWAQFLLLHLGGPDTITALSLEDNELWLRTGLHLGVQAYFTISILLYSVKNHIIIWAPTILILLAGVIKYLERILSLFHGRLAKYSEDEDSDYYAKRIKEYDRSWDIAVRSLIQGSTDQSELTEIHMVRHAFYFFQYYKRVYVDQEFTFNEREQSRLYFFKRTSKEAFRVLEFQLSFTYDAFYTKMVIIQKTIWKMLRYFVMFIEVSCLVVWLFFTKKHGFRDYEIRITHTLLIGAIVVEFFAYIRIQLSNWTIAEVKKGSKIKILLYNRLLSSWKRTWGLYWRKEEASTLSWFRRVFFRWWSESVSQLSLINLYMDDRNKNVQKVVEFLGVKEVLDRHLYVTQKWFSDHIRDFIFEDLKNKAKMRGGIDNICNVKGGWACLRLITISEPEIVVPNVCRLMDIRREYEIILLRWHIITELCYHDEIKIDDVDEGAKGNLLKRLIKKFKVSKSKNIEENVEEGREKKTTRTSMEDYKEICKTLSDYMIYLLINQPEMMPIVAGKTKQRLQHTSKQLEKAYQFASDPNEMGSNKGKEVRLQMACKLIRENLTKDEDDIEYSPVFPFQIEPVMNDLRDLEEKKIGKWKFMAKVWAELVYYAAIRCKPSVHAMKLKQGGELLSFVWLLLVQLGFGLYETKHSQLQLNRDETELEKTLLHRCSNYLQDWRRNRDDKSI
ncbi:hypothetical protein V2J09_016747 [Rumex salicifolius]